MSRVPLIVGAVAVTLVLGLVGLFSMAGDAATAAENASGTLNAAAVPLPAVIPWLERAGALCPVITAPFLAAQLSVESDWDPNAVSSAGAEGLAQFMPSTWPQWAENDDGTGDVSPFNPNDAVMAQGRYDCASVAALAPLEVPGTDTLALVLAAYDYSPAYVLDAGGVPPDPSLASYIAKVQAAIPTYTAALGGTVAASGFAQAEIAAAESQLGVPYSWGGGSDEGPTLGIDQGATTVGFDCSGLVLYAVDQASHGAISLPHSSQLQVTLGTAVTRAEIEPGDVIGFALGTDPTNFDHIGIYLGHDEMIDAPETGEVVQVQSLATSYWRSVPWSVRWFG